MDNSSFNPLRICTYRSCRLFSLVNLLFLKFSGILNKDSLLVKPRVVVVRVAKEEVEVYDLMVVAVLEVQLRTEVFAMNRQ